MGKKLLFAVNPKAGKSDIRNCLLEILDIFAKAGWETTMLISQKMGEIMEKVAQKAKDYDMVVCCGGDGTLNETVNGIIASGENVPLGYIPTGTMNDFAATHNLSREMNKAAKAIVSGEGEKCDLGRFNDRTFTYVAAFGAFSDVSYLTPQKAKASFGKAAYIFEGVKRIPTLKPVQIEIKTDSAVIKDEFIYGMVSNTISVGGFKFFPKGNIDTSDGLLELTLVKNPKNFGETQEAALSLLQGAEKSPMIYRMQVRKAVFTSSDAVSWTLDGEFGGTVEKAEISAISPGIKLMK
ncbi:MAG: YegS/Rv2252/BmrU family lipid kinase [Clostridia bacterium]|nr:YegS/Rv2252/BmrU family lipid kinase [Clostridia bacterium]